MMKLFWAGRESRPASFRAMGKKKRMNGCGRVEESSLYSSPKEEDLTKRWAREGGGIMEELGEDSIRKGETRAWTDEHAPLQNAPLIPPLQDPP